jgi:hypothetical protein
MQKECDRDDVGGVARMQAVGDIRFAAKVPLGGTRLLLAELNQALKNHRVEGAQILGWPHLLAAAQPKRLAAFLE